jgi:hypothetical protein
LAAPADLTREGLRPAVAAVQSAIYVASGPWVLLDERSFQAVTGRKRDLWLAKTVGLLMTVVGAVIGSAWVHRRVTPEVRALGLGSAATLAAVDVVYVARGRISPVYLLDAAVEAAIGALWLRGSRS